MIFIQGIQPKLGGIGNEPFPTKYLMYGFTEADGKRAYARTGSGSAIITYSPYTQGIVCCNRNSVAYPYVVPAPDLFIDAVPEDYDILDISTGRFRSGDSCNASETVPLYDATVDFDKFLAKIVKGLVPNAELPYADINNAVKELQKLVAKLVEDGDIGVAHAKEMLSGLKQYQGKLEVQRVHQLAKRRERDAKRDARKKLAEQLEKQKKIEEAKLAEFAADEERKMSTLSDVLANGTKKDIKEATKKAEEAVADTNAAAQALAKIDKTLSKVAEVLAPDPKTKYDTPTIDPTKVPSPTSDDTSVSASILATIKRMAKDLSNKTFFPAVQAVMERKIVEWVNKMPELLVWLWGDHIWPILVKSLTKKPAAVGTSGGKMKVNHAYIKRSALGRSGGVYMDRNDTLVMEYNTDDLVVGAAFDINHPSTLYLGYVSTEGPKALHVEAAAQMDFVYKGTDNDGWRQLWWKWKHEDTSRFRQVFMLPVRSGYDMDMIFGKDMWPVVLHDVREATTELSNLVKIPAYIDMADLRHVSQKALGASSGRVRGAVGACCGKCKARAALGGACGTCHKKPTCGSASTRRRSEKAKILGGASLFHTLHALWNRTDPSNLANYQQRPVQDADDPDFDEDFPMDPDQVPSTMVDYDLNVEARNAAAAEERARLYGNRPSPRVASGDPNMRPSAEAAPDVRTYGPGESMSFPRSGAPPAASSASDPMNSGLRPTFDFVGDDSDAYNMPGRNATNEFQRGLDMDTHPITNVGYGRNYRIGTQNAASDTKIWSQLTDAERQAMYGKYISNDPAYMRHIAYNARPGAEDEWKTVEAPTTDPSQQLSRTYTKYGLPPDEVPADTVVYPDEYPVLSTPIHNYQPLTRTEPTLKPWSQLTSAEKEAYKSSRYIDQDEYANEATRRVRDFNALRDTSGVGANEAQARQPIRGGNDVRTRGYERKTTAEDPFGGEAESQISRRTRIVSRRMAALKEREAQAVRDYDPIADDNSYIGRSVLEPQRGLGRYKTPTRTATTTAEDAVMDAEDAKVPSAATRLGISIANRLRATSQAVQDAAQAARARMATRLARARDYVRSGTRASTRGVRTGARYADADEGYPGVDPDTGTRIVKVSDGTTGAMDYPGVQRAYVRRYPGGDVPARSAVGARDASVGDELGEAGEMFATEEAALAPEEAAEAAAGPVGWLGLAGQTVGLTAQVLAATVLKKPLEKYVENPIENLVKYGHVGNLDTKAHWGNITNLNERDEILDMMDHMGASAPQAPRKLDYGKEVLRGDTLSFYDSGSKTPYWTGTQGMLDSAREEDAREQQLFQDSLDPEKRIANAKLTAQFQEMLNAVSAAVAARQAAARAAAAQAAINAQTQRNVTQEIINQYAQRHGVTAASAQQALGKQIPGQSAGRYYGRSAASYYDDGDDEDDDDIFDFSDDEEDYAPAKRKKAKKAGGKKGAKKIPARKKATAKKAGGKRKSAGSAAGKIKKRKTRKTKKGKRKTTRRKKGGSYINERGCRVVEFCNLKKRKASRRK